jgi:serine/threonine-protein kinase
MARTIVAASMSESGTVLQPGDRVGDSYEVEKLIGRGGMGEVWAARHLRLANKQVAVKVLHTKGAPLTADQLTRFKREADIATRINHPNVVEVHDYNTLASGAPYLVLELLQGESLASRIRFGALSVEEATQVVRQVGSALDASHKLGVVHRDLKPDNIFLVNTPMGTQVKVLDFGISKVVDSSTLQTADAVLVGTPQYMSPEQAVGANSDVGPQTDVFALGSIAYEMLSGVAAFQADNVAKLVFRIAYEQHTPLGVVKSGLPERVYQAVERALEKDRTRRYASVADFVADFSGTPLPQTLPPPPSPNPRAPSGILPPGLATPESMAWGATAAPTPSPVALPASRPPSVVPAPTASSAPAPAPVYSPAPASVPPPAPGRAPYWTFASVAVVVLGVASVAILGQPPRRAPADTERSGPVALNAPPPPPSPPPAPTAPTAPTAPVAPPEPAHPENGPSGATASVTAKPTAPAMRKRLSPAEAGTIADMEERLKAKKDAYERCNQLMKELSSPEGLSRGYSITTKAACQEHSFQSARVQFDRIEERADREDAATFCRTQNITLQ